MLEEGYCGLVLGGFFEGWVVFLFERWTGLDLQVDDLVGGAPFDISLCARTTFLYFRMVIYYLCCCAYPVLSAFSFWSWGGNEV